LRVASYAAGVDSLCVKPEVLKPLSLELNKTYPIRARLGSSSGLLSVFLLTYKKEIRAEDLLAHQ
jgi:hypothetical protein